MTSNGVTNANSYAFIIEKADVQFECVISDLDRLRTLLRQMIHRDKMICRKAGFEPIVDYSDIKVIDEKGNESDIFGNPIAKEAK